MSNESDKICSIDCIWLTALCVFMNRIQWRSQDFVLWERLKTLKKLENVSYVTWGLCMIEAPWAPQPDRGTGGPSTGSGGNAVYGPAVYN